MRSIRAEIQEVEDADAEAEAIPESASRNLMEYDPPFESAKIKRVGEEEFSEDEEDSDENFDEEDNEFGL
jgi:hypothetical protein